MKNFEEKYFHIEIHNNKQIVKKYFLTIFHIKKYIQYETNYMYCINEMSIFVFYKNIKLGQLGTINYFGDNRPYRFFLSEKDRKNLKLLYSTSHSIWQIGDECEYSIYKIEGLKDEYLTIIDENDKYPEYKLDIIPKLKSTPINKIPRLMQMTYPSL